jgi:hypothetical protein
MRSDPVLLGTATADANGVVTGRFAIPRDAALGQHTVEVTGTAAGGGRRTVTASFTVTAQAPPLPRTGGDDRETTALALMLLGVGCVLLGIGQLRAPEPLQS